jgi:hypothetical protein
MAARPGAGAALQIGLEVAEARCDGRHGQMIARYRPQLLQMQAGPLRQDDAAMAARYRAAHGEGWQAAMASDLAALRAQLQQTPDRKRFCKAQALEARTLVFEASGFDRLDSGTATPLSASFESFVLIRPARGPRSVGFP